MQKIHTDATYKLVWQGYPVLQIGTTDLHRKFHPFGLAVCTHETQADFKFIFGSLKKAVFEKFGSNINPQYLVADAAESIHNAFEETFEGASVIMCWFHMRKALSKRVDNHIHDKQKRQKFLNDIDMLQLSQTPAIFEIASQLFIVKWRTESNELINYFKNEWLFKNRNWYEGFAKRVPSTNNALESNNRLLKDEQTFRERLDLAQFRIIICETVRKWSLEYYSGPNNSGEFQQYDFCVDKCP